MQVGLGPGEHSMLDGHPETLQFDSPGTQAVQWPADAGLSHLPFLQGSMDAHGGLSVHVKQASPSAGYRLQWPS